MIANRWTCFFVCVLTSVIGRMSQASIDELPSDVREAIAQQPELLTPVTVEWVEKRFKGDSLDRLSSTRLTWQDQKVHHWFDSIKPLEGVSEWTFDGTVAYDSKPGGELFIKQRLDNEEYPWPMFPSRYFDLAGMRGPATIKELKAWVGKSIVLPLFEEGRIVSVTTVQLDGEPAIRIDTERDNEYRARALRISDAKMRELSLSRRSSIMGMRSMQPTIRRAVWLSPQRHYALLKVQDRFPDGTLLSEQTNLRFEQLGDRNIWLPRECRDDSYWGNDWVQGFQMSRMPLVTWIFEVKSIHTGEVPTDSFVLKPVRRPGNWVYDSTDPTRPAVSYRIPMDLENINVGGWYHRPRYILLAINVGIAIAIWLYFLLFRDKQPQK